jgi:hypothetical protein
MGCALSFSYDLFHHNQAALGGAMYLGCGGGPTARPLPPRLRGAARSRPGSACSQVQAVNNTLFGNSATTAGGGVAFNDAVQASFLYNILVLNTGGSGMYGLDLRSVLDLRCNDLWHNQPGDYGGACQQGTNLSINPLFCDPLGGAFTLCANSVVQNSPCGGGFLGAFEVACDSCRTAVRPTTWGQLRRLYGPGRSPAGGRPSSR